MSSVVFIFFITPFLISSNYLNEYHRVCYPRNPWSLPPIDALCPSGLLLCLLSGSVKMLSSPVSLIKVYCQVLMKTELLYQKESERHTRLETPFNV